MSLNTAAVDAREKGKLPISIGTSLALEAAFGVYPERPVVDPAPIHEVQEIWFNLRTLFRNLFSCLSTELKKSVLPEDLIPSLAEELSIIESAVIKETQGAVRVVYYLPNYSSLPKYFPKAKLKRPSTDNQITYTLLEKKVMAHFAKEGVGVDLRLFEYAILGNHPKAFIVTHLPVDLLARYRFKDLKLLESHSGHLKAYPQWHTKLTGGKDLTRIPFGSFALQLFGDGNNQFAPQLPSLKRQVVELAEADKWTSVSTEDRIRLTLRKIQNPKDRTLLLSFL